MNYLVPSPPMPHMPRAPVHPAAVLRPAPMLGATSPATPRWVWALGAVAAAGLAWYLLRKRYQPNRATSERAKAQLGRAAERDSARKAREDYQARLRELSARRKQIQRKVTRACEAARKRTSAEVKEMRERERERINRKADAMRAKTAKRCRARRASVRELVGAAADVAAEERDERLRLAKQLREAERKRERRLGGSRSRQKAKEAASESDDQVEANIDADLLPVWRKVKRDIRATPKMSRTEAFLHWVGENESEVWAMREAEMASLLDDLAAEQAAYYQAQSAAEVPF